MLEHFTFSTANVSNATDFCVCLCFNVQYVFVCVFVCVLRDRLTISCENVRRRHMAEQENYSRLPEDQPKSRCHCAELNSGWEYCGSRCRQYCQTDYFRIQFPNLYHVSITLKEMLQDAGRQKKLKLSTRVCMFLWWEMKHSDSDGL